MRKVAFSADGVGMVAMQTAGTSAALAAPGHGDIQVVTTTNLGGLRGCSFHLQFSGV